MAESIFDILLKQFDQYYEAETYVTSPVKLSSCITTNTGNTMRKEPLANLVNCLQLCLARQQQLENDEGESLPQLQQGRETLGALAERMSNCELEDFELVRAT